MGEIGNLRRNGRKVFYIKKRLTCSRTQFFFCVEKNFGCSFCGHPVAIGFTVVIAVECTLKTAVSQVNSVVYY
jgi:hypothetical protein